MVVAAKKDKKVVEKKKSEKKKTVSTKAAAAKSVDRLASALSIARGREELLAVLSVFCPEESLGLILRERSPGQ